MTIEYKLSHDLKRGYGINLGKKKLVEQLVSCGFLGLVFQSVVAACMTFFFFLICVKNNTNTKFLSGIYEAFQILISDFDPRLILS